jgi:hypothetical protein
MKMMEKSQWILIIQSGFDSLRLHVVRNFSIDQIFLIIWLNVFIDDCLTICDFGEIICRIVEKKIISGDSLSYPFIAVVRSTALWDVLPISFPAEALFLRLPSALAPLHLDHLPRRVRTCWHRSWLEVLLVDIIEKSQNWKFFGTPLNRLTLPPAEPAIIRTIRHKPTAELAIFPIFSKDNIDGLGIVPSSKPVKRLWSELWSRTSIPLNSAIGW